MHQITYRPDIHALDIMLSGLMNDAEVTAMAGELTAARAAHANPRYPDSLYDFTAATLQPQTVVAMLQDLARRTDPARRVALYSEGGLARMQAARIAAAGANIRTFDSRAAALAWLGEGGR